MVEYIRKAGSGRYFCGGTWTASAAQAERFSDSVAALECIRTHRLEGVEIVLQFGKEPSDDRDIAIAVRPVRAGGRA